MRVSFNSSFKNSSIFDVFNNTSTKMPYEYSAPSQDEIITAKTKKAVSECKYVFIALGILYFAMKRNIKVNRIKNSAKKAAELAKMEVPPVMAPDIKPEAIMQSILG